MTIKFFNAGMAELDNLNEGFRLMRAHTNNPMNDDDLYFEASADDVADGDFENEVKFALARKYGRSGAVRLVSIEDVTDDWYDEDGNVLGWEE